MITQCAKKRKKFFAPNENQEDKRLEKNSLHLMKTGKIKGLIMHISLSMSP